MKECDVEKGDSVVVGLEPDDTGAVKDSLTDDDAPKPPSSLHAGVRGVRFKLLAPDASWNCCVPSKAPEYSTCTP